MIVLGTLGVRQRRLLDARRKPKEATGEPEPVPTSRATLIRAAPHASDAEAARWLDALRSDRDALREETASGARELNDVLRAYRAAAADPYARDVSAEQALVVRAGYGSGEQVADGRFADAIEMPPEERRTGRTERLVPQERLAALLGAREKILACEELVLRARADLDARRPREAALQARIALEAILAELEGTRAGAQLGELAGYRREVGDAANAALAGEPPPELVEAVDRAVERMERELRRHRLTGMER